MIKLINPLTGSDTWVHEGRVDEYLARGFHRAPAPEPKPKRSARKKNEPKGEK